MVKNRTVVLFSVLAIAAVVAVGGWVLSSQIKSPADLAARAAPPVPSPILVPVEERELSSNVVTRGTARLGLPQPISIVPSSLKAGAGLISTLPLQNTPLDEGDVVLTSSGRPMFILKGEKPVYRDLSPGVSGDDVRQLEQGLKRLGFDPRPIDGYYSKGTSNAVAKWYKSKGWEPFGPTQAQLTNLRTLEQDWADAQKRKFSTAAAAVAAALSVKSARATADLKNRAAETELAVKRAEWRKLMEAQKKMAPSVVETARATAELNNKAAAAEVEALIAKRATIMLDPRQPETARKAIDAKLEMARAAAHRTQLEGEAAIQAAERNAKSAVEQLELAAEQVELSEAAVNSIALEGEMAVRSADDALQIADFEAKLADERANQLRHDLNVARSKLGVQVPADEIVFIPALPVRVKEITARVGEPATGTVLTVTDNQLVIDASLTLDAAPLVKPRMKVDISEQSLGVKATGVVETVADSPGTHGVDGYHVYFKVRVDETPTRLEGFSLRLSIPIKSSGRAVTAVPISALSLAADGTSRVQVKNKNTLEYITVEPGLAADGFVEVVPLKGTLEPGQMVVVGYKNPDNGKTK